MLKKDSPSCGLERVKVYGPAGMPMKSRTLRGDALQFSPVDSQEALAAEYEELQLQTEALRREHKDLQSRPVDLAEHEAHRARLRAHIEQLHAHIDRLRHASKSV